jgi:ankyrin repeat protein
MPLLSAAVAGHELESAELLLQAGARPDMSLNYPNGKSYTALMQSAAQKCCDRDYIVKLLLEHGADPCKASADGTTALHLAASAGHISKCSLLLAASNGRALALQTVQKRTPLWCAVEAGHLPVVQLLHKEYDADFNITDANRLTLLHVAVLNERGDSSVLGYLLDNGLSASVQQPQSGLTPLHAAAVAAASSDIVQMLLDYGAMPNAVDASGNTPVHSLCAVRCLPALQCLLRSTSVDVNAANKRGATALHTAVRSAETRPAAVQTLLDFGADPNRRDAAGCTHLHLAAAKVATDAQQAEQNRAVMECLLRIEKTDVNAEAADGFTCLVMAAVGGDNAAAVQLLLEHGADPDHSVNGTQPLDVAIVRGYTPVLDVLLSCRGADAAAAAAANTVVDNAMPLLVLAVQCGEVAVARLLLEKGANVNAVGSDECSALLTAVACSSSSIERCSC